MNIFSNAMQRQAQINISRAIDKVAMLMNELPYDSETGNSDL